ncbi:MAG: 4-alpha-glucanotransferase [Bacteroidota bacterium]
MVCHFYLKFRTFFGQSVSIAFHEDGDSGKEGFKFLDLQYHNEDFWYVEYDFNNVNPSRHFFYHYILKESGKEDVIDYWLNRSLTFDAKQQEMIIYDDWQHLPIPTAVFKSRVFTKVLNKPTFSNKIAACKSPTHNFSVHTTQLASNNVICLLGSSKELNNWDVNNPVFLSNENNVWSVKLDLSNAVFPIEYKYAICDIVQKKVVHFEDTDNRILTIKPEKGKLLVLNQFADFINYAWKGTGVNVQLSALKTLRSWGVGDFTDINKLADWSFAAGIKMIQLLPINDTTATFTIADSYPYSAISAFALHPIFLDIPKIANDHKLAIPENNIELAGKLNQEPVLNYETVLKLKLDTLRIIFENIVYAFQEENSFVFFFNENKNWLMPYAAFCFLRDKFQTADFNQWDEYKIYDEKLLLKLVDEESGHFNEIAFYYFTQYHLHLQLTDAVDYAHQLGIIIKGDLPIGVGRYSVDTWMNPFLFHMDMQAGAPPDAFAKKGQNWSFPTYNWDAMKRTDYNWWRLRLTHMSHYFDATRIDHVLGFFRIWSVPVHAIEGIMGVFVPAIPISKIDFIKAGISFDESRFCNPYFTDEILTAFFNDKTSWVKDNVLTNGNFKSTLNTQRKLDAFSKENDLDDRFTQILFDLLAEVILLKDDKQEGQFHFRIDMQETNSFKALPIIEQQKLNKLYVKYFYENQNDLWNKAAQDKLDAIQQSADMMICAEDLGMVPDMVEEVLMKREMLALQVQRMPKQSNTQFSHPENAPYLSVVTPSTHDMSTIRQWWEEDTSVTQIFYNHLLLQNGKAPFHCKPWICKEILLQHLKSPAMWAVFLLQDLMALDEDIGRKNPAEDRMNNPANPNHHWDYRMHVTIEFLIQQKSFTKSIHQMNTETKRG